MGPTVHAAFLDAAAKWPHRPFLHVLRETAGIYGIPSGEIAYAEAAHRIAALQLAYRLAGYGAGHRVGLLLENRPDFIFHWFALNGLGAGIVPINPDLRAAELEYLVAHSEMVAAVAIPARQDDLRRAAAGRRLPVFGPGDAPPPAPFPGGPPGGPESECALLYTSGSTGLPKGCIASQEYVLECGRFYVSLGGLCEIRKGVERMLTPLPLFHMNAIACSTMAMMLTGGCLAVLDRFHPRTWWQSVAEARATIVHCLGVMPALLMQAEPTPLERDHHVRFSFGPGVDRRIHAAIEERFGIPFIDAWAMTESGAGGQIVASHEPRHVGTSCFGRALPCMEVRVEREDGTEAGPDDPGELLIRRAGDNPRFGFFSGYLKDP
jgi:acyl-CoA synthetase (AMP-forming)/AMP-acid ligase II